MKLLIADDDDYTRLGLLESVDWITYGIEEIKEARDGAEALREAEDFQPDIVLTDIRMPKLNGIEFAEKLKECCKHSKLLFMSGYMDVDYLKSAIKLSAVDYIEKPIKLPDLESAVMKAVDYVRINREQLSIIGQKLGLQRQHLAGILRSRIINKSVAIPLCKEVDFPVHCRYVCIVSTVLTDHADIVLKPEVFQAFWDSYRIPSLNVREGHQRHLTILPLKNIDLKRVIHLCSLLIHQHSELIMGMGCEAAHLESVADSHETASRALERSFYNREQRFFCFEEINRSESKMDLYFDFLTIFKNNPEQLPDWLEIKCNKIRQEEYPKRERVCELFHSFAQAVFREKGTVLSRLSHACSQCDVEKKLLNSTSLDELQSVMKTLFSAYIEDLREAAPYSRIVREVMKYVASHCGKIDLDVREIADHVHMSTNHLGLLFRNETGFTIRQYIVEYRLELAKKMIMDEHYKMNTIAERCGYASPSYFTKVFRASTKLTPLEYRKLMTK